mgnify:FL=1
MKVGKTVCKMQNNVFPTVFYMRNCANNYNTTLGHNMFLIFTNCLHELGKTACRQFKSTSAIALPNRLPE